MISSYQDIMIIMIKESLIKKQNMYNFLFLLYLIQNNYAFRKSYKFE